LTEFLNRYLTPITDCIMESGGFVDKYVGDGVMAVWGAPYRDPEHAFNACSAALEQQRTITEMNDELRNEYGSEIHVRMGLNSGTVTAGNMGSERKFQYTVMGDVVNLASRLEPANKDFGTKIVIGEATRKLAGDRIEARMLDKIVVVGKQEIVSIYELLGLKGALDDVVLERARRYEEALDHFYGRRWDECVGLINDVASIDTVEAHLKSRAEYCKVNPPADTWQGEYVRVEKT
jgi:adenylate cyclase